MKTFLLTGVPAVGKTTLAKNLKKMITPIDVITFGEVIQEVKQQRKQSVSYSEIRSNPTREATTYLIEEATKKLVKNVRLLKEKSHVLIDSHAVARDSYGYRATPDNYSFLQSIGYDGIFVLHGDHKEVAARVSEEADGRLTVSTEDVASHQALQDSVAIAYAIVAGCPVYFIETKGESKLSLVKKVLEVFDHIGVVYDRVGGQFDNGS